MASLAGIRSAESPLEKLRTGVRTPTSAKPVTEAEADARPGDHVPPPAVAEPTPTEAPDAPEPTAAANDGVPETELTELSPHPAQPALGDV